ncbi:polysaccharide deacetylase family protein [Sphingomonas cavernae]|uniref:Polysaccharide deacetylase n=1 Tax=Sphingomonas cavernae TaxID=2320861 RepID=A0A418W6B1_9SPHN|nr:polysaccharide deacetylase family protein [Sphingomonas cavernae]RJF85457.1 polysaccharide deacetylase [Sphingomonas cavernae]
MQTRVLLTVDTELAWRHHAAGLPVEDIYARSIEPAGVGLGYQLQRLREHGLKACFFVDPMPATVFGLDVVKRIVAPILEAGQEIQLHLHPNWAGAEVGDRGAAHAKFELIDYEEEAQRVLIAEARELLVKAGAPTPIAFRAGSYSANDTTLKTLAELGFRYDSSHNGSENPWPSAISLTRRQIAPVTYRGVVELPVTLIEDRVGRLRHCQICALSLAEVTAAIDHAIVSGHAILTLVSHSFELATRDGLRENHLVRRRFDRICEVLAARADRAPTAFFTELDGLDVHADALPAPPKLLRTAARMGEQLLSNIVYERRL